MSNAPENIYVTLNYATKNWLDMPSLNPVPRIKYRRADLPPIGAECLRNEKVRALIQEATMLADWVEYEVGADQPYEIRAALAAMKGVK